MKENEKEKQYAQPIIKNNGCEYPMDIIEFTGDKETYKQVCISLKHRYSDGTLPAWVYTNSSNVKLSIILKTYTKDYNVNIAEIKLINRRKDNGRAKKPERRKRTMSLL